MRFVLVIALLLRRFLRGYSEFLQRELAALAVARVQHDLAALAYERELLITHLPEEVERATRRLLQRERELVPREPCIHRSSAAPPPR
jgi:hypothetical protein